MKLFQSTNNSALRVSALRKSSLVSAAVIAVLASSMAVADESGWYVGGNIGQAKANIDVDRITSGLLSSGLSTTAIDTDERDLGFKLFGGYQFNRHFALESGYFDLGKFGFTATTIPAGSLSGEIKVKGLNLDAVGFVPFTDKWSAFGRVGLAYAGRPRHFRRNRRSQRA